MRIVCFGWGSLIWDPRSLPIQRQWFEDGPSAPVEFTRQSSDGRMTLVIEPTASAVRLLWALMLPGDLQSATEALRDREGIKGAEWTSRIGSWQKGRAAPAAIPDLPQWAEASGVDAALWTGARAAIRWQERIAVGRCGDRIPESAHRASAGECEALYRAYAPPNRYRVSTSDRGCSRLVVQGVSTPRLMTGAGSCDTWRCGPHLRRGRRGRVRIEGRVYAGRRPPGLPPLGSLLAA